MLRKQASDWMARKTLTGGSLLYSGALIPGGLRCPSRLARKALKARDPMRNVDGGLLFKNSTRILVALSTQVICFMSLLQVTLFKSLFPSAKSPPRRVDQHNVPFLANRCY